MKSNAARPSNDNFLEVKGLRKLFPVSRGIVGTIMRRPQRNVHAVDGVTFSMKEGEIIALVGESGSGKTTTALCCTGLIPTSEGEIWLEGKDVQEMASDRKRKRSLRQSAQLIFQDPYESLNPRQTVFDTIAEPLEVHGLVSTQSEKINRVTTALNEAGLRPPADFLDRYPQELSGGQRQRTAIARTLVLKPDLLLMDEPFASLDAPTREALQDLIVELHQEHRMTIVAVTHTIEEAAVLGNKVMVLGQPPNTMPTIFENVGGGKATFRGTHAYQSACSQLRAMLEDRR